MSKQIFRLEDSLRAEIASVLDRVLQIERILDKQTADIETLRQEYFALLQAVRRIEDTLKTMNERDEKADRALQEVFTRLERVETRLTVIEAQIPPIKEEKGGLTRADMMVPLSASASETYLLARGEKRSMGTFARVSFVVRRD